MITVTITRNKHENMESVIVEGHANYAEYGKDIVCAAVSAVTIGTANSINILSPDPAITNSFDGFLSIQLPFPNVISDTTEILMKSMLIMLQSIIEAYPGYVQLKEVAHAY